MNLGITDCCIKLQYPPQVDIDVAAQKRNVVFYFGMAFDTGSCVVRYGRAYFESEVVGVCGSLWLIVVVVVIGGVEGGGAGGAESVGCE